MEPLNIMLFSISKSMCIWNSHKLTIYNCFVMIYYLITQSLDALAAITWWLKRPWYISQFAGACMCVGTSNSVAVVGEDLVW